MYYALVGTMRMNIFGVPLVGADTGFARPWADPEMAVRWHQVGAAAMPFFRNHNSAGKPDQQPSAYADPYRAAMRAAIAARYALVPYWYTLFARAHADGATVTRPLFFEFPGDAHAALVDTQAMVGAALMVSPVLEPNATARDVYFPNATWYAWPAGARVAAPAGAAARVPAPLEACPVHVRGGHIVPTQAPGATTALQAGAALALTVALDAAGAARGELWMDDGASLGTHERGVFLDVGFDAAAAAGGAAGRLTGRARAAGWAPAAGAALLARARVLGVVAWPPGSRATANGAPAAVEYDAANGALEISWPGTPLAAPLDVTWGPA